MIKILHIIKSLGRGGAEMLLPETLKLHRKDIFEFHCIYFLPWKDAMVDAIRENGGKVTCLPASNNALLMLKIAQVRNYVRANNIQLIHAHLPWAGILARYVGSMTGVPVIYTEHNKQERYHFLTRWMNLATMNRLTRLIAVSKDVEESTKSHKKNLRIPVMTIVNGVNTEKFTANPELGSELRKELQIPTGSIVVGTIAVFRFQKRLDIWLENARRIADRVPEARFIIVGDGPLKGKLHSKAAALGLTDIVHFVGLQTDVRPYLAAMDIYLMSSIFEGLPVAMLEAMASECAVVTTDAGGIKEVIQHEVDGLICKTDEPEKLAEHVIALVEDPEKRRRLALQGRKRVENSFSLQKMVRELEALYETTAGGR